MSRSKKQPFITDQNAGKPQHGLSKRKANRKVRHKNKISAADESEQIHSGKEYRKVSETYDIRDWSSFNPKDKKAYRK
jgi:hypothetical protein